jgi:hypothetical protein
MKKFLILLLSIVVIAVSSSAQDCTPELLAQKPGDWKAGPQGSIANVLSADLVKEKGVLADIHKMVSGSYKPMGCQLSYSMVYGKHPDAGQTFVADPYYYVMRIMRYICDGQSADKSKYYVDISTSTSVSINTNVIYSLDNLYAANIPPDDFRGYFKLEERPVIKDGYYYMGEKVINGAENRTMEYRWLITYNDTLPFSCLSRKEYLVIQKKKLEKSIRENSGDKDYTQRFLDKISEYLNQPESELSQDAICMRNDEERFNGFVEEGTKGSFIAVKPNLEYYHKKLPKSSPQFFTVICTLTENDPVFEANISAIKEALDFAKLKNMLGK